MKTKQPIYGEMKSIDMEVEHNETTLDVKTFEKLL